MVKNGYTKLDVDALLLPTPSESITQSKGGKVNKPKSKRHKPIRSCAFCRKRKLKCDQQKPMCSSCKSRDMHECIYTDSNSKPSGKATSSVNGTTISARSAIKNSASSDSIISDIRYGLMKNHDPNSPDKQNSPTDSHISTYEGSNFASVAGSATGSSGSEIDDKIPNPFRNYYYIQCKDNGRTITYGPTALRTFIMRNNWGFKDKYMQLWKKIKLERNTWKKKYKTNTRSELDLMELEIGDSASIINDVLPCLPDFDSIKSYINDFFDEKNSNLYEMNTFLDKRKILYDLEYSFIQDRQGTIIQLKPTNKKNYFKIAVILMILVFTKFRNNIPVQIFRLITYLTGLVSPKTSYIEKAQFLLQQIFYTSSFAPKADETSLIGIVSQLTTCARTLGLHLNIKEIYRNRDLVCGHYETIENLWTWVLYFDFELSLRIGKRLDIDLETFNDINYQEDNSLELYGYVMNNEFGLNKTDPNPEFCLIPPRLTSILPDSNKNSPNSTHSTSSSTDTSKGRDFTKDQSFFGKMRRFLFLVRPMIGEFYKKTGTPKVVEHGQVILKFLDEELKPIKYATDPDLISELTFGDIRLILTILDIITIFYSVGFILLNHRSVLLKNISIQAHLLTFSIFKNLVNHCFELDNKYFPEMVHPSYNGLSPYLSSSLGLSLHPVLQSLGVFYAFFFLKATLFENGIFVSYDMKEVEWDMSSFSVPTDKSISLITTFSMYKKIFEDWISYDKSNKRGFELKNLMLRSYSGLILITLEKTYRIIVEKALEHRKKIESSWIAQGLGENSRIMSSIGCEFPSNSQINQSVAAGQQNPVENISAKQAYHGYLQYQFQLEEQNQINELQRHIEILNEKDKVNSSNKKIDENITAKNNNILPENSKEPMIISSTGEKINAVEAERAQKLVDDFWSSYNTGWEKLLNDSDLLFQDFENEL
ncbi:similar to Saccharomyces cerevisiae YOR172W YRM1 Zn2-Cys6 zinc-finger transcription factor that activates genes involved in multidrug resistance [Maudiozyma saulgeensis]|uniref:Similar to Saccharomyces cerevisiae YOR172W YRM1 Zn2-Cys6 zinc-finger transcription factor that activates genes involved in multidrug resistance n=1 Tax=Maudiozyma saulgeensis TaxID=1789683 RepID=A0A1X7RBF3_9SACH|nr:similar to Saccharomyces cerevisiae YOR172W YRM1 Zn2-Cys6 zinc-finger transcription factor that activates genes involved in multidrug resistance [Kazachstania saulgeensis]